MAIVCEICNPAQTALIKSIAMKRTTLILLYCLLSGHVFAQTEIDTSLQQMEREMQEIRQLMQDKFQKLSKKYPEFANPEWKVDTSFQLHFDTIFGNGGLGFDQRFFNLPFDIDESFFQEFFNFIPPPDPNVAPDEQFKWFFPEMPEALENDENSVIEDQGDGLLPEERLRSEPGKEKAPVDKKPSEESKKPKIKTIRI